MCSGMVSSSCSICKHHLDRLINLEMLKRTFDVDPLNNWPRITNFVYSPFILYNKNECGSITCKHTHQHTHQYTHQHTHQYTHQLYHELKNYIKTWNISFYPLCTVMLNINGFLFILLFLKKEIYSNWSYSWKEDIIGLRGQV